MAWRYETCGPDGRCRLFGVNIFDYDWQTTGRRVKVQDPNYHQEHIFGVWQVEIGGEIRRGVFQLRVGLLSGGKLRSCTNRRLRRRLASRKKFPRQSARPGDWYSF